MTRDMDSVQHVQSLASSAAPKGDAGAWAKGGGGEPDPPVIVPLEVSGLSKIQFTITTHLIFRDGKPAPPLE